MLIPLTQGKSALIDDADYDTVSKYNWYYNKDGKYPGYARAKATIDGKRVNLTMHRLLLNPGKGLVVDHIDGNTLNNRIDNIRACSQRQNAHNAITNRNIGHTEYDESTNRWASFIVCSSHTYHIGYFGTRLEADKRWNDVLSRPVYSVHGVPVGVI